MYIAGVGANAILKLDFISAGYRFGFQNRCTPVIMPLAYQIAQATIAIQCS